jgi:hypothetical protein
MCRLKPGELAERGDLIDDDDFGWPLPRNLTSIPSRCNILLVSCKVWLAPSLRPLAQANRQAFKYGWESNWGDIWKYLLYALSIVFVATGESTTHLTRNLLTLNSVAVINGTVVASVTPTKHPQHQLQSLLRRVLHISQLQVQQLRELQHTATHGTPSYEAIRAVMSRLCMDSRRRNSSR